MYVLACLLFVSVLGCQRDERPERLGINPESEIPDKQRDFRVVTYNIYCWKACNHGFVYVKAWLDRVLPTTDMIAFQEFRCWCGTLEYWMNGRDFGGKTFKRISGHDQPIVTYADSTYSVETTDISRIGNDRW